MKNIISVGSFKAAIETVKACVVKDSELSKVFNADIIDLVTVPAVSILTILAEVCKDEGDWISWYCWETDFGKHPLDYFETSKSKAKILKNVDDLYNLLCKNYKARTNAMAKDKV